MTHSLRTPSSAADRAGFSIMKQDCRLLLPRAGDQIRLASRLIASAILFAALGGVDASAAPILASATRTAAFLSTSTTPVSIPLRESGAKSLKFDTTVANQKVVIIYNAECVVAAPRGSWLSISILVDGIEAEPSSGTDFALCSAVDAGGQTWSSVVRQSALKVPAIGSHTVTILAHLLAGSGSWRLDDSSLVVQPALALATREDDFLSSAFSQIQLPLKQDGTKELNFSTNSPNEHLKITYNAECVVAGSHPAQGLRAIISVGLDFSNANADLCHAIDSTGKTWAGAAQQMTLTVPTAGTHTAQVFGNLTSTSTQRF
jgi:hypothetical protein